MCETRYEPASDNGRRLRRIADHVRACAFAIHENVYPGPNKEKYVIRRLLRRAVLDGHQMGRREPFLHQLVPIVAEMMSNPYPELRETTQRVASVIRQEEQTFLGTIDGGLQGIEKTFETLAGAGKKVVDGAKAAELYQTHGVPAELFEAMAAEKGFAFDWPGYRAAMEEHGKKSGGVVHTVMGSSGPIDQVKETVKESVFVGYDSTEADVQVRAIIVGDKVVDALDSLPENTAAILVLDRTPFYGESGGQVGDCGQITSDSGQVQVVDTQKDGDLVLHQVAELVGRIAVGQKVTAQVDRARRDAIRRAHSATHILHYALQKNLGKHAQQQGSKVTDDWLRFDFTNLAPVSPEQLEQITTDVRERIVANETVGWKTVPLEEARAAGAMMLFGEKYPDPVRMVSMGQFSRELCGGTHLTATGDVEAFEVVSEEGVSAGTRRITAFTGDKAREYQERTRTTLQKAATTLGVGESAVPGLARQLLQQVRDARKQLSGSGKAATPEAAASAGPTITDARQLLRETARLLNVSLFEVAERLVALKKEAEELQRQLANREAHQGPTADDLLAGAALVQTVRVVVAEVPGSNSNLLRQMIDQIRQTVSPCAIFLATAEGDDKVVLVAGVSRDLQGKLHAGNWVKEVAPVVGGGGGGKPDLAQAGGKDASKLPAALQHAKTVVEGWLKG